MGQTWWGALEIRPLSVPLSLHGPSYICLPNICFFTSMWVFFLPFEFPSHDPPSFALTWRWYLRWGFQPFWQITQSSWVSLMCSCYQIFVWFSFANLSHNNFILRPARKTLKVEENFLFNNAQSSNTLKMEPRILNEYKIVSLINSSGKTGYLYAKE